LRVIDKKTKESYNNKVLSKFVIMKKSFILQGLAMKVKICFLMLITVVFLSACFSPWKGDTGTFSISIGSSAGSSAGGRTALPWAPDLDSDDLEHIITLEGPGPEQTESVKGAGTVLFSVVPGVWNITVEAYEVNQDGGEEHRFLAAVGSKTVEIKAGFNGTIAIPMGEPDEGSEGLYFVLIPEGEENAGTYRLESGGTAIGAVVVPAVYEGKPVTEIGIEAFAGNKNITSITIPASIKSIGAGAFYNCTSLTSVTFEGTAIIIVDYNSFPGFLSEFYLNTGGGIGTWIRDVNGSNPNDWTKLTGGENDVTFSVSSAAQWNAAVTEIKEGGSNKTYTINVINPFELPGSTDNTFGNVANITVNLIGTNTNIENPTIYLLGTGSLLRIGANQTVTMKDINLKGQSSNNASLVYIYGISDVNSITGGSFTMEGSASVSGNTATTQFGGGVQVTIGGTFTMRDNASVSNNICDAGGGVGVLSGGTFIMNGGKVSLNSSSNGNDNGNGGGVNVNGGGTFTMNGGEISGNTSSAGGGVYVGNGTFTMNGGEISGNTSSAGGGVSVGNGTFRIVTGTVYGSDGGDKKNTASLFIHDSNSTAQYGNGTSWESIPLNDYSDNVRDATIKVVDGQLVEEEEHRTFTWTAVTNNTFGESPINAIAYGNGKFVAGGGNTKIAYSTDGKNWTPVLNNPFSSNNEDICAIAFGNGRFVAGGTGTGNYGSTMAYSTDGVTWIIPEEKGPFANDNGIGYMISAIAHNGLAGSNSKFIAVNDNSQMAYSTDGEVWIAIEDLYENPFGDPNNIHAIAYGDGMWVAGGDGIGGKMVYSTDGVTWNSIMGLFGNNAYGQINAIAYDGNKFVAVSNGGQIAYFTKEYFTVGSWTLVDDEPFGNYQTNGSSINAIAYGNGRFVAVSYGGQIAFTDDENWTLVDQSLFGIDTNNSGSSNIYAIAYGNGKFVAVGFLGRIAYAEW
jgi:hypothetical protein